MSAVYDLMDGETFAGLETHEEMLSDGPRVRAYHRGIHRAVKEGDVVLDLGTGTGLLAFMASRAGAKKVYAIEHSDFIEVAREIAEHNGFTNVEFIRANSRDWTPPEQIDIILQEQMGDELFNENMIENLLDLRDRVLAPGGRILPAKFRLFVEPITMFDDMRIRRFWNIALPDGIDLSATEHSSSAARFVRGYNEQFWVRPNSVEAIVATPEPILEFDMNTLTSIDSLPSHHIVERTALTDAIVDGFCIWFEAVFDEATVLSTSPLEPLTSWGNRTFRLDREVKRGQVLRYEVDLVNFTEPGTWNVRAR